MTQELHNDIDFPSPFKIISMFGKLCAVNGALIKFCLSDINKTGFFLNKRSFHLFGPLDSSYDIFSENRYKTKV